MATHVKRRRGLGCVIPHPGASEFIQPSRLHLFTHIPVTGTDGYRKIFLIVQSVFSRLSQGLDDDSLESSIRRWADTVATYCLGRPARSSQILLKSITKHRDRREKTLCRKSQAKTGVAFQANTRAEVFYWIAPQWWRWVDVVVLLLRLHGQGQRRGAGGQCNNRDSLKSYRVTKQNVQNLPLTLMWKLRFIIRTFC